MGLSGGTASQRRRRCPRQKEGERNAPAFSFLLPPVSHWLNWAGSQLAQEHWETQPKSVNSPIYRVDMGKSKIWFWGQVIQGWNNEQKGGKGITMARNMESRMPLIAYIQPWLHSFAVLRHKLWSEGISFPGWCHASVMVSSPGPSSHNASTLWHRQLINLGWKEWMSERTQAEWEKWSRT